MKFLKDEEDYRNYLKSLVKKFPEFPEMADYIDDYLPVKYPCLVDVVMLDDMPVNIVFKYEVRHIVATVNAKNVFLN